MNTVKKNIVRGLFAGALVIASGSFGHGDFFGVKAAFGYGGGGGGGPVVSLPPAVVNNINVPLDIVPGQTGNLTQSTPSGVTVNLTVEAGAITSGRATFTVSEGTQPAAIGNRFFEITATNAGGVEVTNFGKNLNITLSGLSLPADTSNLAVFYLNETTGAWVEVPGASFDPAGGTVTFGVNHLTKFAVFVKTEVPTAPQVAGEQIGNSNKKATAGRVLGEQLGSQAYADGTLLRGIDKKIYVVVKGELQHVATLAQLAKYAGKPIIDVADVKAAFSGSVQGEKAYRDGTLLRGTDKKVYVVINGKLKHIATMAQLRAHAGKAIVDVSNDVISGFGQETAATSVGTFGEGALLRGPDKKIYVIVNGKKRHVASLEELRRNHLRKPINEVGQSVIDQY